MGSELPALLEVRRGEIVEARHRGAMVVAESDGRTIARLGDDGFITSTRSTIKPIQAIPFVTSGAADRFGITSRELAVACGSHNGEPLHTRAVERMLSSIGLDERALRCGAHAPYSEEAASELTRQKRPFTQLHNNCSGKHAGMLATAIHRGLPAEDYVAPDHPVQREILSTITAIAGLEQPPPIAVDGCSAPTFGVPLRALAIAFARLVSPWNANHSSNVLDQRQSEAAKRIVAAMSAHPEMVGGTRGRFDTDLMRAAPGKLVCKVGAESAYSIGVLPSTRFPRALGIAIKIEDGGRRALYPAVIELLAQLGVLTQAEQERLSTYHHPSVENHRGIRVGELRPVFKIEVRQ